MYSCRWLNHVKTCLLTAGLGFVWYSCGSNVDNMWLQKQLKLRLQDIYKQEWSSKLLSSVKCANYAIFKKKFEFEKYLTDLSFKNRTVYCKFRCRNSKIRQELYTQKIVPDNMCHLCSANAIGDEFHYVLECTFFSSVRRQYLPRYFCYYPSPEKFNCIFNSKGPLLNRLCKLLHLITKCL